MSENMLKQLVRATAAVVLCLFTLCRAQVSDKISRVNIAPPGPGTPLLVLVDLFTVASIDHIQFAYRPFGRSEYRRLEMALSGNSATVSVPAAEIATSRDLHASSALATARQSPREGA